MRIEYGDLRVGYKVSFPYEISLDDINNFVLLSGDKNPLHVDIDYGKKSVFSKNIVHGMLLASLFSRIVGMYFGENVLYLSQNIAFKKPSFVYDKIIVEGVVVSKSDSTKVIGLDTYIYRNEDIIISGTAKFKYLS